MGGSFLERLDESVRDIRREIGGFVPEVGLILGSGLGSIAEEVDACATIPFAEVSHMGISTANGHAGRFVIGELSGAHVICMQGRLHGYEGYDSLQVAWPVWVMHRLGVRTLIATNAAGAIDPDYHVGDLCLITDHINLTGRNPLQGIEQDSLAPRFPTLYDAYDPGLRTLARESALSMGIPIQEGVYIGVLGPSLETPAEIRAFRRLGADVVAMSLVEEVIAARHVGMRVLGISLCSNMACGVGGETLADDDILAIASERAHDLGRLLDTVLRSI